MHGPVVAVRLAAVRRTAVLRTAAKRETDTSNRTMDEAACLRIMDDSGEDCLYAAKRFVLVDVPKKLRGRLLKIVKGEPGLTSR